MCEVDLGASNFVQTPQLLHSTYSRVHGWKSFAKADIFLTDFLPLPLGLVAGGGHSGKGMSLSASLNRRLAMPRTGSYEFGRFRLDAKGRILFRDSSPVPLPPKAVDTLLVLIENAGAVVEKEELLNQVWKGTFVLGVSHVLEGIVRRTEGRVRIAAQLIKVDDESHLWVETYDRNLGDILKIQSEVAQAVAREIRVKLTARERRRLGAVGELFAAAYESYLLGRHLWNKRTEAGMRKSILHYEEAARLQSDYAMAYVGIADSYVMLACRGMAPAKETFLKAKLAARKALELDGDLAEAHGSLAHVRLHDWDWNKLEEDFERAIELNPSEAIVYYWFGEFLMSRGRPEEAIAVTQRAHEIDPLSPVIGASLGMILYLARRYEQARAILQRTGQLNPDHFLPYLRLGYVQVQQLEFEEAIQQMQAAVRLADGSTETLAALAIAYAATGKRQEFEQILRELERPAGKRYVLPYNIAKIYSAAGNADKAFDWLETAYNEGNPDLIELNSEPLFDCIREDSRFSDLMGRVGWNV
jgi:tetratricopeptide (TPR) repeat protein